MTPVRFALVLAGDAMQAWEAACAQAVIEAGGVAARVIVTKERGGSRSVGESERPVPFPALFGSAPIVRDGRETWPKDFDVALAFEQSSALLAVERGVPEVWTFAFGGPRDTGLPLAFDELSRADGGVEARLVRITTDGRHALKTGVFPTNAHSYARTVDIARFGAASWPARVVAELARGCQPIATAVPAPAVTPRDPRFSERARLTITLALRAVSARWNFLFRHEHWNIGLASRPIESFVDNPKAIDVRWLDPPNAGTFVADPFACTSDGATYLLCERFDYRDRIGYLASGLLQDGAQTLSPFLRLDVHLSYPFSIAEAGEIYCIPEMSQSGEIALYRAQHLPEVWERVATLVPDFGGCDPTVTRYGDRWWMFCTNRDAPNHELHAYHAEQLRGPWIAHARNPIKIDVRSARPAGTPFMLRGALHRPAQDCAGSYGRRVVINRVDALTPDEFEEHPVAHVEPDPHGPYRDGLHTLSAAGDRTLVDGKSYRFVPSEFVATAAAYIRHALSAGSTQR